MNALKAKLTEFSGFFGKKSPLLLALILIVIIAIPIDIISKLFGWINPEEIKAIPGYIKETSLEDLVYQLLIVAPLTQEFLYRGPVRLLILFFPKIAEKGWAGKLITWAIIIAPTYYWARCLGGGHGIPLDAFLVGLFCGYLVVKTKSLESAVALHLFYNAINLVGALIRFKIL